jgi:1D-myo-inositol-tetrakisphosphate 5-kinase/inositol-polyphosphate multikinase
MFDSATNQQILHTKEYIKQITEANITESFLSFFFPSSCYAETLIAGRERVNPLQNGLPIPSAKIRWIIQSLIDDIEEILETVASMPDLRIYGASLLIIYEGDRSAAMEAWGKMLEEDRQQAQRNQRGHVDQEPTDDKSECEDEEAQSAKLYSIRMIDFAHSEWTSGQFSEQDEGILLGLKNAANMLRSLLVIQRQDNL